MSRGERASVFSPLYARSRDSRACYKASRRREVGQKSCRTLVYRWFWFDEFFFMGFLSAFPVILSNCGESQRVRRDFRACGIKQQSFSNVRLYKVLVHCNSVGKNLHNWC